MGTGEKNTCYIQLRTGGEAKLCNCPMLCFKEQFKQFRLSKRDSCPTFPSFKSSAIPRPASRPLLKREQLQGKKFVYINKWFGA